MSVFLDRETLGASALSSGPFSPLPPGPPGPRPRATFTAIAKVIGAVVVGGSGLLFVGLIVAERFAPEEWRPSTLLGAFGGRQQAAAILSAIEAKRAEAAVLADEQGRVQQGVIALQADNDRVTKAYEALYQRGNMLAQEWARGANQILAINAQQRMAALTGRAEVSSDKDKWAKWCDFASLFSTQIDCGDQLRASAYRDRQAMSEEIIRDYEDKAKRVAVAARSWAEGLIDPAQVVADLNRITKLHPLPTPPVPPAPFKSPSKA
jgi:hypothetical protein